MSENEQNLPGGQYTQASVARALNTYATVEVETSVNSANPLELIVLLYDGAINNINGAEQSLLSENYATKGRLINRTLAILDGLRDALDFEQGGEIAQNLYDLYEYMKERLTLANLKNDLDIFDEVRNLLTELRNAWAELANPGSTALSNLPQVDTEAKEKPAEK